MKCVFDTIMYPMNNRSLSIDKWESNYKQPVICRRTKLPPTWESHLIALHNQFCAGRFVLEEKIIVLLN
uniref:Uncharacterized protein n=1 Tax=Salix viminalis TaxID=40686 RepID=A0A6N2K4D7_SALVM